MSFCFKIRYSCPVMILSLIFVSANTAIAQEGRIRIRENRISAGGVINAIERQSAYRFSYNLNDFDTTRVHNFPQTDPGISDALDRITKDSGVEYVVRDRNIAFVPRKSPPPLPEKAVQTRSAVSYGLPDPAVADKNEQRTAAGNIINDTMPQITLLFRFDSSVVDRDFMDNARALDILDKILNNAELISKIDSIIIEGTASPDGNPARNRELARRRTDAMKSYVLRNYPHIDESRIKSSAREGFWNDLLRIVIESPDIPGRDELKRMIEDPLLGDAEKSLRLHSIQGGRTFAYLRDNLILRSIRTGSIISFIYRAREPKPEIGIIPEPVEEPAVIPETAAIPQPPTQTVAMPELEPESVPVTGPIPEPAAEAAVPEYRIVHPVALKTNLLLDLMGAANLGIEIPIGGHFSVAADVAFSHTSIKRLYALQGLQVTAEARYWFKPRKNILTGWNLGAYAAYGGRFDVQWIGGMQGDGYFSTGLSGGYSFRLSDSFNLDLSVLGGFIYLPEIREYGRPSEGHLIWEKTRYNASRVAPVMIRANLVWLINKKVAK